MGTNINITLLGGEAPEVTTEGTTGSPAASADAGTTTPPKTIKALGRDVPVSDDGIAKLNGKSLLIKEAAFSLEGKLVGFIHNGTLQPLRAFIQPAATPA